MTTGEGFESVLEDVLVGVCAYGGGYQYPVVAVWAVELVDGKVIDASNIRAAP